MSVIAELSVSASAFELGRIMALSSDATVELESLVPAGDRAVPFFWVYGAEFEAFEGRLRDHRAVEAVSRVDAYDDRVLYTFKWSAESDALFCAVQRTNAYILSAAGSSDAWRFELRFPSHEALSRFQNRCGKRGVCFDVHRVYSPDDPEPGPRFGLTERQREAIALAVEKGYYDIPRGCTTAELARELGISDQAVTERLRRAIDALVTNTVLSSTDE